MIFKRKKNPSDASWHKRFSESLSKTRKKIFGKFSEILGTDAKENKQALMEALESGLLASDIGVATTQSILSDLSKKPIDFSAPDVQEQIHSALKAIILSRLACTNRPFKKDTSHILIVGVNGTGKTTTVAKLAYYCQKKLHLKTLIAAGDTFRAAAIEQLQSWGTRYHLPVIAQKHGADSAAVVYDAMEAQSSRGYDLLLVDTAGRLTTQTHLIAELDKIKRVMAKKQPNAPEETLLVLDGTMGQNALVQAETFHKQLTLTGIIISKLDSSARGGILLAIVEQLQLPIYFLGMGEKIEDLIPFNPEQYVDALLGEHTIGS